MPKPKYLQFDNLDDRKEVLYLLEQLPPWKRVAWLKWCCSRSAVPNSTVRPRVAVRRTTGEAREIFFDLWALAAQYELDIDTAVLKLVEMVRKRESNSDTVARLLRIESAARLRRFGVKTA